jgi:hypothetical protein
MFTLLSFFSFFPFLFQETPLDMLVFVCFLDIILCLQANRAICLMWPNMQLDFNSYVVAAGVISLEGRRFAIMSCFTTSCVSQPSGICDIRLLC